jgi:putative tryptophan/tyrosine transport system substrate-binding protein
MRRREFMTLLSGALLAGSAARAQQMNRTARIGVLIGLAEGDPEGQARMAAFRQRLEQLGWTEGRNLHIEYRWSAGDVALTRAYAEELVALAPDVIAVNTPPGLQALRQATSTLPIVFVQVLNAMESAVVPNPVRPGANITGFTNFYEYRMSGKWLELLKALAPTVRRVAIMQNPEHPSWPGYLRSSQEAAPLLGLDVIPAPVREAGEIDRVIDRLAQAPNGGLLVLPDSFTATHRQRIVSRVAQHRLPAVYPLRYFVASGGIMSYGAEIVDLWRGVAEYVDRILRGANPGDLPVQSSSSYRLVINLKAAEEIGIEIPTTLLAVADEVIE